MNRTIARLTALFAFSATAMSVNPAPSVLLRDVPEADLRIIQGIDAAVQARANAVSRYTVQEHYALYRNGATTPAAEETIQTVYVRSTGKEYTPIAQSGSGLLRSAVIDRVLAGEREVNLPKNRESSWITSKNYEMHPESGRVELNGIQCIVVDLTPLRESPHLFNGKVWIDASDYTVVHLEGTPSASPSAFAGQAHISRDYIKVDGFSMATHAEARAHTFLFGDTLLKIDYSDYKIETYPATQ